jgi:hypothetical protein
MGRNAQVSRRRRRQLLRLLWITAIIITSLGSTLFLLWRWGSYLNSSPDSIDAPADATEIMRLPAQ